ncbi:MAG: hypothetical protein ACOY32_08900 [Thermodesulfobacteriota bacterium]
MKRFSPLVAAVTLTLFSAALPVSVAAFPSGSALPSCHDDIIPGKNVPGTAVPCTPLIMNQDSALEFMKKFSIRKINKKWYLFISEEESKGGLTAATRWQTIDLMTSAVQSLFNDNADCLIVRAPQSSEEKQSLLSASYPQKLIAAQAVYVEGSKEKKAEWAEYHHHQLYTLTVY